MHKLRVGIVVDLDLLPESGGIYSYYSSILNGINNFEFDEDIEIVNLVFYKKQIPDINFKKPVAFINGSLSNQFRSLKRTVRRRHKTILKAIPFVKFVITTFRSRNEISIENQLVANKIDIVYYLTPNSTYNLNYPFITTHWDVGHKSTLTFPEITLDANYEKRENYYINTINKALLILCESDAGAKELLSFYNFNPQKVKVFPLFSNSTLKVNIDNTLSDKILTGRHLKKNEFFIYPAQFWAHKNHYNLLIAFHKFKEVNSSINYKLVLCGSDKGNLAYIKSLIADLGLKESVIITGFVSDEELFVFYTNAIALVMPTFLGPTNMPLIEAAQLKCPVLCSDLGGHREIMEEHALYFEPADAKSIEDALLKVVDKSFPRESFINDAFEHIHQSKFNLNKGLQTLNNLLLQIKPIRKTWGYKK
jgi:glycosyltransferase involved in cell wall biosynthesis